MPDCKETILPASRAVVYEGVNPPLTLRTVDGEGGAMIQRLRREVAAASISDLLGLNAHWFFQPTGMRETVAVLWLINTGLSSFGIAPAWRRIPAFIKVLPPPPAPMRGATGPRPLGDTARRSLIRRWVDLEWLLTVLPPGHIPRYVRWKNAFSSDPLEAERVWSRVNAVRSHGGGRVGAETPYKVVYGLNITGLNDVRSYPSGQPVLTMPRTIRQ